MGQHIPQVRQNVNICPCTYTDLSASVSFQKPPETPAATTVFTHHSIFRYSLCGLFRRGSPVRARVYAHEDALSSVSAYLTFYYHPLDTDVSLAYTAVVGGEEPTGRQEGRPAVWPAVREPLMDRDSRHEGGDSPQADPTKAPNNPPPPPTVSRRHRHRTVRITLNRRLITRRHPQARLTSTWLDRRTMARDHTGGLRVWLSEPATSASRSMRTT